MVEYKQIPKMVGGRCCLCKKELQQFQPTVIYIYDDEMNFKKISEVLFYCPVCMVHYANADIFTHIRINNPGYRAFGFMNQHKNSSKTVIRIATTFPDKYKKNKMNGGIKDNSINSSRITEHPHQGFDTYPIKGNKAIINVYVINDFTGNCIICNKILSERKIQVPVSNNACIHYMGVGCGEHFFIKPSKKIRQILNDNQFAGHIKIHYDYFFKNYILADEIYRGNETNLVLILMKLIDCGDKITNELVVIVGNKEQKIRSNILVVDYREDKTRQLLTDVIKWGKKEVVYSGKKYQVHLKKLKKSYTDLILDSIVIQSGGGYCRSIKNKHYKLVDVLMYSPYSQKYEIVHATFDNEEYICFMDISIFRAFVSEYGNPGIKIYPTRSSGRDLDFLNEESLLHAYGYTVNQKDNLSDKERCDILAEVIDLELMLPQAIMRFLAGCADRANGKNYERACLKYKHDMEFVCNYKVNPQRFLIFN